MPESLSSSKVLPLSTPSAPRAMSSSDLSRSVKGPETGPFGRHRDNPSPLNTPLPGPNNRPPSPQEGQFTSGSLRSRIGEKEMAPRPDYPFRPEASMRRDDERDNRKRTASDRDPESGTGPAELPQGQKRAKLTLQRNRYAGPSGPASPNPQHAGVAKRTLPIDRRGKD